MLYQGKKKNILDTLETDAVTSNGDSQVIAPTAARSVRIDLWKLVANSTNCKHLKIKNYYFETSRKCVWRCKQLDYS